jgi:hypothetical protein
MLEVKLLGKFEVQCNHQPVEIPLRAAQSLLAYLMLTAALLIDASNSPGCSGPTGPSPTPGAICAKHCHGSAKRSVRVTSWRMSSPWSLIRRRLTGSMPK